MRLTLFLILFFKVISCSNGKHSYSEQKENGIEKGLSYVGSEEIKVNQDDFAVKTEDTIGQALYTIHYIGKIKESVQLKYNYDLQDNSSSDFRYDGYDPQQLKIHIDTTSILGLPDLSVNSNQTYIRSFPVILFNDSEATLNIGSNGILPMTLEAKTEKGEWLEIENPFFHYCHTDITSIYLPPGEVVVTSMTDFDGPIHTRLRLKFQIDSIEIYSNEIAGKINLKQLNH